MRSDRPISVIGGGGHARVVISTIRACGMTVGSIFDDDPSTWDAHVTGAPITGPIEKLREFPHGPIVVAIGDGRRRRELVERIKLERNNVEWTTLIHPTAFVDPTAKISEGTVVFAGAVVQPDVMIGAHVIVNTASTIDHDCVIGDYVHIAPGANLCGNVRVGVGAHVGAASVIIENLEVQEGATVGAGAVVIRSLPRNVVAVGCPANVVRQEMD